MKEKAVPQLSFIIPLYNEEAVISLLHERMLQLLERSTLNIEVILIDDGSADSTAALISNIALNDKRFTAVILSRNFGHQPALSAGLEQAKCTDAALIIDGDLQDPPEIYLEFYKYYQEGYDVVYGIRKKRKENPFKKLSYKLFYKLLKKISYINIPLDSGDFSMISRRVIDALNQMPEESRFLRGMRSWIGYKQIGIEYERSSRASGEPKYSFTKLVKLALNGIFNFSELPIKFITMMGIAAITVSSIYLLQTLYKKIILHAVPEGFTALIFAIVLFSGVQLLSLGVIGEYVLRIFFQVKQRPLFIVSKVVKQEDQ